MPAINVAPTRTNLIRIRKELRSSALALAVLYFPKSPLSNKNMIPMGKSEIICCKANYFAIQPANPKVSR